MILLYALRWSLAPPPSTEGALAELLHADSATRAAADRPATAAVRRRRTELSRDMEGFLLRGGWGSSDASVRQDLGQEVASTLGPGIAEELLGGGLLGDTAGVHEHDPIGGLPREAHLMGDHQHGHAFAGQLG